jgi:hypothetical protein
MLSSYFRVKIPGIPDVYPAPRSRQVFSEAVTWCG